jgi:biopolymer transport protein ExbD
MEEGDGGPIEPRPVGAAVGLGGILTALHDVYVWAQLRAQRPLPSAASDCREVRVTVTAGDVVLHRVGRAPARAVGDLRVPRVTATRSIDRNGVGAALGPPPTGCSTQTTVSVAAEDEVSYEDVVDVMDAAMQAGYEPDLDVGFESRALDAEPLLVPSDEVVRRAPRIVVRSDAVLVEGVVVTRDLHQDVTPAVRPAFARLRANAGDGLLVLQADRATPARVIRQMTRAALDAGFRKVLFAVKQRS